MAEGPMGENSPGGQGGAAVRPSLGLTADGAMGAAAHLCHMLEERKRAVVAGFLTRGPAFAATSLASSDAPHPTTEGKPVKEGGRRKGKKAAFDVSTFRSMSPEQKKDLLSQASPEQLANLRGVLQARLLEQQKVKVEGKEMNMLELAKKVQKEQALHDVGGDEATLASVPGTVRRATMPMTDLRPEAPKEQMRVHEQDALPLDRLCRGDAYSPAPLVGMRRDFTFGIYANASAARKLLKGKWAKRNPEEVITDQEFYDDVMSVAPYMDVTLLVMPTRRLPLKQTVATFAGRMRNTLTFLSGGKLPAEDSSAIETMASRFTVPRLSQTRLIDRGQVAKESQFLFTIGSKGQLAIEGITPAPLRDRRPVFLGSYLNKRLAPALLAQFLGPDAIDDEAKAEAGASLVFAINGFKFGSEPQKKNQYLLDETTETGFPAPVVEEVVAGPQLFQYPPVGGPRRRQLLLNGISSAGRGQQQPQLEAA